MPDRPVILYVEDNPMNRTLVKRVLESRGFQVEIAEDGLTGLQRARELMPRLILMDIGIPGCDGLEITRRLKADPDLAGIPVVALTAFAMAGDRDRALAAGCTGYITKPIDVVTFPATVGAFLAPAPASSQA